MEVDPEEITVSKLLIKNQQLQYEIRHLNSQNKRFEKYVSDSIYTQRGGGDIMNHLTQIEMHSISTGLEINQMPSILQDEYAKLIERKKIIDQ